MARDQERPMLSLEEARERLMSQVPEPEGIEVELAEARGRFLLEALVAGADFPAADISAMDGFALRAADLEASPCLRLAGSSLAGRPHDARLEAGCCIQVMTGGVLPEGADAILPVERSSGFAPREDGTVRFEGGARPGDCIRPRGSIKRQGELCLRAGTELDPGSIGVCAHEGKARVRVGRRPKVAVLPTGDEVVAIEAEPGPAQVRNSNAAAVLAQAQATGADAEIAPVVGDDPKELSTRLAELCASHDLVCTIGGVSMGTKDHLRPCFASLGGETFVHAIRIKPGKPTLCARLERDGRASVLLGLPGNPASASTIFALLGRPFLRAFQGEAKETALAWGRARLRFSKVRPNRRLQALPGLRRAGPDGTVIEQCRQVNSADLFSLAGADALFLAQENEGPRDGDLVDWAPLY